MAFQTSIFRDGEWVTETVNLQAALKASASTKAASDPRAEPPVCGILSQTIAESPVVRWVLPVRLRSREHNDIAFIGSSFIQISELQKDGQVRDVLRINSLGSRIRNAIVIGDSWEYGPDDDGTGTNGSSNRRLALLQSSSAKDDSFRPRTIPGPLPPQRLACMLESGQLVFLFIKTLPNGSLEFSIAKYESPAVLRYIGYHLIGDPSSRYIAAASPDGMLVVYELESLANLNGQYMRGEALRPVRSVRVRMIRAVVHRMEFLFPRPQDEFHIILVMIVVRREGNSPTAVSRLLTYEWEAGDDLQTVFAPEKRGHRLPPEYQMPTLLIPIRFNTAFFAISAYFIGVVKCALAGSLQFDSLPLQSWPPTRLHYGGHEPLWTAWARPFRTRKYFEKTDVIYLAREDGAVIHLEIDATEMMPSVTGGWSFQTNIDRAFTTAYDIFSDVLIIGGDAGPGGIWKLAARSEPEQVNSLPNWAPVVDLVAANENTARTSGLGSHTTELPTGRERRGHLPAHLRKPDDIFSASGRGLRGNIAQWRWGIQARIGLDIELSEPARQAWAFTVDSNNGRTLYGLLALPAASSVLQFREDLGEIEDLPPERTSFDLTSRTLHATQVSNTIIQVTETSISVVTPTETSSRCLFEEALDSAGFVAEHAFCMGSTIALSRYRNEGSELHILQAEGMNISRLSNWGAKGAVTCLSMFTAATGQYLVAASMDDEIPWVTIYSLSGNVIIQRAVRMTQGERHDAPQLEALTSIVVFCLGTEGVALVLGSRCGHLVTAVVGKDPLDGVKWNQEGVGVARADVFSASGRFWNPSTVLVCCDDSLILMTDFSLEDGKFNRRHYIFPVDLNETSLPSPAIHSVFHIPQSLSGDIQETSLMILSGPKLLLANVGDQEGLVPRTLPLAGTPTKLIYSQTLRCLVVALLVEDRPTLAFIDPKTGLDISVPADRTRKARPFISGLGQPGDKIYGLYEWQYVKDGSTFRFILVTTKSGNLIIVSAEATTDWQGGRKIHYWTKYKKKFEKPIYSIVGDPEGLLYCVDTTIHWDVLDLTEKKLRGVRSVKIDSPATSLQVVKGKVLALTTLHSLLVIDHPKDSDAEPTSFAHSDQVSRRTIHMIDVGDPADGLGHWPLNLISEQFDGVVGIWIPWGQQNKELEIVFEADLAFSVRRFLRARIRPPWHCGGPQERFGTIPTDASGSDLIGVGICGSMARFRLLSLPLWRVLSMIEHLARGVGIATPFPSPKSARRFATGSTDAEPRPHPEVMQVDGDVLATCLKTRALHRLVGVGDSALMYRRHLDALEDGRHTEAIRGLGEAEQQQAYLDLGYEILTFLVGGAT